MRIAQASKKGFTLVELLVSITITALLMVGIATFFSSTFRNMFTASQQSANDQSHFVVNSILASKFTEAKSRDVGSGCLDDCVVLKNDKLNFTYIGVHSLGTEDFLAFKDFFIFNGIEGNLESIDSNEINNPGGITELGGNHYIASPLENKIYKCDTDLSSCSDFQINEALNQPMDITNNEIDTLYLTDAGNNRILEITNLGDSKDIQEVASGFNFPTGIEFYSDGTTEYLFVSDTNSHQIKKIDIVAQTSEVVVGQGDDELCNNTDGREHSALYCKLSFPTGLLVANEGNGDELYISDTGNNRILKVSDPDYPTALSINFSSPDADEAIKEIILTFPGATDASGGNLNVSSDGNLNTFGDRQFGDDEGNENKVLYKLWTKLISDTASTNACSPEPCTPTMNKAEVDNHDLFESPNFNNIRMESDDLVLDFKNDQTLEFVDDFTSNQPIDTPVILTEPVTANTNITFDISGIETSGAGSGFLKVNIEMFDENDDSLITRSYPVRIGDETLGTFEDIISVVPTSDLSHPTGLSWHSDALQISENAEYDYIRFSKFDYVSDFEIQEFNPTTKNSDSILELSFEAKSGENTEGTELWEEYIFNTAL